MHFKGRPFCSVSEGPALFSSFLLLEKVEKVEVALAAPKNLSPLRAGPGALSQLLQGRGKA